MKYKLLIVFFLLLLFPSLLFAVDVSLGASAWYCHFDNKVFAGNGKPETVNKMDPQLMYGPVMGLMFSENWSFTSAFLYNSSPFVQKNPNGTELKSNRLDSDNILNYNLNQYFKVFIGLKYQYIKLSGVIEGSIWDTGPGGGLGISIPIAGNLYGIINASYMYTLGRREQKSTISQSTDLVRQGYNLVGNFAYYIEQLSLIVTAGYRYQYYRTEHSNSAFNDMDLKFYGYTCSVIFSF